MVWTDTKTGSDYFTYTEYNNMVTYITDIGSDLATAEASIIQNGSDITDLQSNTYTGSFDSVSQVNVNHALGTKNVIVQMYDNSGSDFMGNIVRTDENNIVLDFGISSTGSYIIMK